MEVLPGSCNAYSYRFHELGFIFSSLLNTTLQWFGSASSED